MSRYVFHELIGTGGMGEVWRATDTTLNREVAIKLLKPEHAEDPIGRSRFESEAKHAAALHHPNVVAVYDVGEMPTASGLMRPFLVMELVDHKPLSELIRDGRPLAPEVVRDLLGQAGDALAAAHRAGIVHRDVKPANLLITPQRKVKVTDFGIARAQASTGITGTGQVMGTPQYLSPEQARGEKATPASDVYSLGVVAFECLAGYRPFQKETPVATAIAHLHDPVPPLPDHVPADLAAIVMRSLQKDPTLRYADAAAFTSAIVGHGAADQDADATTVVAAAPGDATATSVMDPVPSPTQNYVGMQGAAGGPEGPPPPRYQDPYDRYDEDDEQKPWYKKPFNIIVILMLVAVIVAIIWIIS
ncbi:MAG TPA: protein kinase, partial [Nocardioides sp.]